MKDYKVGDTIYVKGKITDVDHNKTMLPYCVVSGPNYHFWASQESVLDELPTSEPVKPVLPKDVAEEMEHAKDDCGNFFSYLADSNEYPVTISYAFAWGADDAKIKILSDAWYNGYTIEKEKKYNLILGTDGYDCIHAICKRYDKDGVFIDDETYEVSNLQCDQYYQFTQEEIDKYNKNFWIKNIDLNDYKVEVHTDED